MKLFSKIKSIKVSEKSEQDCGPVSDAFDKRLSIIELANLALISNWTEEEKQFISGKWDCVFNDKETIAGDIGFFMERIQSYIKRDIDNRIRHETANLTTGSQMTQSTTLIAKNLECLKNIRELAKEKDSSMPGTYALFNCPRISRLSDWLSRLDQRCKDIAQSFPII
jgi:hypothetical protein